jgi:hypothetical protein
MSDDFADFDELLSSLPKPSRPLPDELLLLGEWQNTLSPFLLDADSRLVIWLATPQYYARMPVFIPTSVGVLEEAPSSGSRDLIGIDVVNVTASAVSFTLYLHDGVPSSAHLFAANNLSIPANGQWRWRGVQPLETKHVWGLSSTANALAAIFSIREPLSSWRRP